MSGYSWFEIFESLKYPPIIDECTQYRLKKYSGTVSFYLVACRHCQTQLFAYQKDGDGPLLRCYLDRIRERFDNWQLTDSLTIQCRNCLTIISFPQNYYIKQDQDRNHFEKRLAYELLYQTDQ